MALPKLSNITYELELPSTGESIKYRPFLVKEQKTLMILQEGDSKTDVYNALTEILNNCTFNTINATRMPIFDFEYVFL